MNNQYVGLELDISTSALGLGLFQYNLKYDK